MRNEEDEYVIGTLNTRPNGLGDWIYLSEPGDLEGRPKPPSTDFELALFNAYNALKDRTCKRYRVFYAPASKHLTFVPAEDHSSTDDPGYSCNL